MDFSGKNKIKEKVIYLDYQSTTPCDERVVEAMLPYFVHNFANANSEHILGKYVAKTIDKIRADIAEMLGVASQEIIFTSGATESNNIALQGSVRYLIDHYPKTKRIITIATEHKSVLETVQNLQSIGADPFILPVQSDGLIDPDSLKAALQVPTILVSVMAANNETGVIQNIPYLSALSHEYGALFHCDLSQACGKISEKIQLRSWGIDLASISGHKIYGPKGIGILYVKRKPRVRVEPLFYGGYQERGIRSGTLPVPLIVGLGKAFSLFQNEGNEEIRRLASYKHFLINELQARIPQIKINGSIEYALSNCVNLQFPEVKALDLLARIPHLCLSTGSACNHVSMPSYVLQSMGLSEQEVLSSIRLSFGRMTTKQEVVETVHDLYSAWYDVRKGT